MNRSALKKYAEALAMWASKFDTTEIAVHLKLPEFTVAKWVANYRDLMATA